MSLGNLGSHWYETLRRSLREDVISDPVMCLTLIQDPQKVTQRGGHIWPSPVSDTDTRPSEGHSERRSYLTQSCVCHWYKTPRRSLREDVISDPVLCLTLTQDPQKVTQRGGHIWPSPVSDTDTRPSEGHSVRRSNLTQSCVWHWYKTLRRSLREEVISDPVLCLTLIQDPQKVTQRGGPIWHWYKTLRRSLREEVISDPVLCLTLIQDHQKVTQRGDHIWPSPVSDTDTRPSEGHSERRSYMTQSCVWHWHKTPRRSLREEVISDPVLCLTLIQDPRKVTQRGGHIWPSPVSDTDTRPPEGHSERRSYLTQSCVWHWYKTLGRSLREEVISDPVLCLTLIQDPQKVTQRGGHIWPSPVSDTDTRLSEGHSERRSNLTHEMLGHVNVQRVYFQDSFQACESLRNIYSIIVLHGFFRHYRPKNPYCSRHFLVFSVMWTNLFTSGNGPISWELAICVQTCVCDTWQCGDWVDRPYSWKVWEGAGVRTLELPAINWHPGWVMGSRMLHSQGMYPPPHPIPPPQPYQTVYPGGWWCKPGDHLLGPCAPPPTHPHVLSLRQGGHLLCCYHLLCTGTLLNRLSHNTVMKKNQWAKCCCVISYYYIDILGCVLHWDLFYNRRYTPRNVQDLDIFWEIV